MCFSSSYRDRKAWSILHLQIHLKNYMAKKLSEKQFTDMSDDTFNTYFHHIFLLDLMRNALLIKSWVRNFEFELY